MTAKTRIEHLRWCKTRAHQEYRFTACEDPKAARENAIASMISDLGKHPDTKVMQEMALTLSMTIHDERSLYRFIDGFTE